MRRRLNWRWIAIVAAAIIAVWFGIGIWLAGREPVPAPNSEPITLFGGKVTGNRISTRSWSFDYTHAQMSPDGMNATITGVKNGVLYKKGKPYLKISARQVSVNTQSFDFTAIGTVHIESVAASGAPARSFETDLVQWTNATKILLLSHPSIIRTGDETLKVSTASVDFNKDDVHLGKVDGGFQVP
jgi:hypothetical protein